MDYSTPGLKLTTILDDPLVTASHLQVYASHTKQITIQGSGFLSSFNHHDKPEARAAIIRQSGGGWGCGCKKAHYVASEGENGVDILGASGNVFFRYEREKSSEHPCAPN